MPTTTEGTLVSQVVTEILGNVGKPYRLAVMLEEAGYVSPKTGERYSESNIYAWASGKTAPPAEVLLVAARLAGVSIDEYIAAPEAAGTDTRDRERLAEVETRLGELAGLDDRVRRLALLVARIADRLGESEDDLTE